MNRYDAQQYFRLQVRKYYLWSPICGVIFIALLIAGMFAFSSIGLPGWVSGTVCLLSLALLVVAPTRIEKRVSRTLNLICPTCERSLVPSFTEKSSRDPIRPVCTKCQADLHDHFQSLAYEAVRRNGDEVERQVERARDKDHSERRNRVMIRGLIYGVFGPWFLCVPIFLVFMGFAFSDSEAKPWFITVMWLAIGGVAWMLCIVPFYLLYMRRLLKQRGVRSIRSLIGRRDWRERQPDLITRFTLAVVGYPWHRARRMRR
ncbi:MAG: hypothetical protein AAGK09_09555 [Planctomycetota bacterium]